ncbi:MAG: pimeloyl-ACP methyl ester carboxylesterase [Candidatus Latescibacterota bacterium]|jgi:pimeloyl-ACP methyl ester carboxylesterase
MKVTKEHLNFFKEEGYVAPQEKELPIPGEVFSVKNHTAFLLLPAQQKRNVGTPWIWYAPTLPGLPSDAEKWMFEKFLHAGIAIAGIDVGESYGNLQGRDIYSALYKNLVHKRGLSKKACLLARSRGGLMLYNWAIDNPSSVACIAGIYPVCNLSSYPGLSKASGAYGLNEEQLAAQLAEHNPIDRLEALSKAHIPIFHIHGDDDQVVPLAHNSGELAKRYQTLGGKMTLKVIEDQGHNMWMGWFQCQELVDFIVAHTKPMQLTTIRKDNHGRN